MITWEKIPGSPHVYILCSGEPGNKAKYLYFASFPGTLQRSGNEVTSIPWWWSCTLGALLPPPPPPLLHFFLLLHHPSHHCKSGRSSSGTRNTQTLTWHHSQSSRPAGTEKTRRGQQPSHHAHMHTQSRVRNRSQLWWNFSGDFSRGWTRFQIKKLLHYDDFRFGDFNSSTSFIWG